jgi:hypothetical protein
MGSIVLNSYRCLLEQEWGDAMTERYKTRGEYQARIKTL